MTEPDLSPEAVEALAAECDRLADIGERRAGEEVPPSVSLSLMHHVVRQHTLAATLRALSARLADAERRAEEAEVLLIDVMASLAAAISLLERAGKPAKKAAPSDQMFNQMLADYRASLERARATLRNPQPEEPHDDDR